MYYIGAGERPSGSVQSVELRVVPVGGVDVERSEDAWLAAGDDVDRAVTGGESDVADAVPLS